MMTMGETINKALIFVAGAAVGSAITWKVVKTKYEHISNEEVNTIREYYANKKEDTFKEESVSADVVKAETNKPDITQYASKLKEEGYTNYSDISTKTVEPEEIEEDEPYVIPPEEFGEFEDYDTINLTLYADGCLADDFDELLEDADEAVGWSNLKEMGKYEPDALHIRNDKRKCDYEILNDLNNYRDVVNDDEED